MATKEDRPTRVSIDVRDLSKRYGSTVAVEQLTFRVEPGRVTGFLGPNGAGKSTTMRMMIGLDRPTGGEVLIGGRPYSQIREPLREVGALLDPSAVHPGRRARDQLLVLARSNRIPDRRVDVMLDRVGLAGAARRRLGEFSLGMRQRLGLAAALLGEPRVLILDEPLNGLDPEGIQGVRGLLRELAEGGRVVLVSSHLMNEMAVTADHLVVIGRGRLLADVSMTDFGARYGRGRVRLRTTRPERLGRALIAEGLTPAPAKGGAWEVADAQPDRIGVVAARERVPLQELALRSDSLEEAFLRLTAVSTDFTAEFTTDSGRKGAPE
ncbi:ABC-2 type transport system ATP-binding protein [Parafrankia irregularis]|uniref:ABC-2 type transport system ATP-binding protein n=1 Tax=Parafrankia irregularis TaxID=795642 RepID=A0A0S4QFL9_9ACTN|nr:MULTISPECIES: ATP-binding cassette domain-containing protein [Parafrankia]MBE3203273.1 ATP-binding cassette domain-containing protein [Parafrankia sp. CH37]CUU54078.1 ABC-2 type transport system ATP-binding protein [Parafrankia irregularis]